jgi:hypothetical protein
MSSDGSTVVVSAPFNNGNGSDAGHARVYSLYDVLDGDSDGVLNGDDFCPATAPGSAVDGFGCAAADYVGATGPQGLQGAAGLNGINGTNGTNGTNGIDGTDGAIGPAGADGTNGLNGAPGPQGPEGVGPAGSLLMLPVGSPAPVGYTLIGNFQLDPSRVPAGRGRRSAKSSKSSKGGGNGRLAVDVYIRN